MLNQLPGIDPRGRVRNQIQTSRQIAEDLFPLIINIFRYRKVPCFFQSRN